MAVVLFFVLVQSAFSLGTDNTIPVNACEVGDVVQNGRVTCTCMQKYVYECVVRKLAIIEQDVETKEDFRCQPNKMYKFETTTCICNQNGTWPHRACGEIFDSLPTENLVKTKCEPDGYVFVDCNVCRCNTEGNIEKGRCTQNKCDEEKSPERRSSGKPNNLYGSCQAKNWYSFAPCQFCFCVNENKLVCNTGNHKDKKLELGNYNLNVCGKGLIKEAIELIPDSKHPLRHGTSKAGKKSKPKLNLIPSTTFKPFIAVETALNTGVEVNMQLKNKDENDPGLDSEGDSSEVEKVDMLRESRTIQSTQIPFQDDYQLFSREYAESFDEQDRKENNEEVENSDNEIENTEINVSEPGLRIPVPPSTTPITPRTIKPHIIEARPKNRFQELGRQFAVNLPLVLKNVLRMAGMRQNKQNKRKSMVSIDYKSECSPGTVEVVKCNTCFCLKNKKMLCTQKQCD